MVAAVSVGHFPTIGEQIVSPGGRLHQAQYEIVTLAAAMHESDEWVLEANTAAHWIADVLDIAVSTAREWVRIGRALIDLQALDEAFRTGRLSYSKVRAVSRVATPENELDLIELAERTPASRLGIELAAYLKTNEPDSSSSHSESRRRAPEPTPAQSTPRSSFTCEETARRWTTERR